ncbi:MAG: hypothetical protein NZ937_09590, partial [Armatimonadetes bacterium]|nr:hypothetical protein [Armatimonadota bacterium]
MKDDVLEAFEILLEAMKNEKNQLANEVKEATLNSQFNRAQRLITKAEQIERLIEQARQLKEAWKRLSEEKFNEKFDATQQTAKGQLGVSDQKDKAPEIEIVRQLFGGQGQRKRKRREPVNKTPQRAYRVSILEALEQLGGRGSVQEVLK